MFIAIATDDFGNTFPRNNEGEEWHDYTTTTDYPIFTGMTVEETRELLERYIRVSFDAGDDTIPEYEICEIVTDSIFKADYKLTTELFKVR